MDHWKTPLRNVLNVIFDVCTYTLYSKCKQMSYQIYMTKGNPQTNENGYANA